MPRCTQHLVSCFWPSFRDSLMMARAAYAKCLHAHPYQLSWEARRVQQASVQGVRHVCGPQITPVNV